MFAVLLVLSLHTVSTIIASIYAFISLKNSETTFSSAILYEGSCSVTKGWETGSHLIINILSTGLLAASNYCMQYLNAPTREDVDQAHKNDRWLSIGVTSSRNVLFMGTVRKVLWSLLLISSLPIHLM